MTDDANTAKSIFLNALEIPSGNARQAYVVAQCGGDESLGGEVEALLRQHGELGSFLETPVGGQTLAMGSSSLREGTGTTIGPYKLLQQIGEGGMGIVFMAEQQQPVQRKVALKIIKPGICRRDGSRPALFCYGIGQRNAHHHLLRRASPDSARAIGTLLSGLPRRAACAPKRNHPPRLEAVECDDRTV
jgi:hypothetical protein